jgi:hypothetical protein
MARFAARGEAIEFNSVDPPGDCLTVDLNRFLNPGGFFTGVTWSRPSLLSWLSVGGRGS